jgi:hypothetical protein
MLSYHNALPFIEAANMFSSFNKVSGPYHNVPQKYLETHSLVDRILKAAECPKLEKLWQKSYKHFKENVAQLDGPAPAPSRLQFN